jgi:hypothetical protein
MLGNKIKSLYYKTSPTPYIKLLFSTVFLYPKAWDIRPKAWDIHLKAWDICPKAWDIVYL